MIRRIAFLEEELAESRAMVKALLSGQIDAVVDSASSSPILVAVAQTALRRSEERYRQIVESTTDGITEIDATGAIVFANHRMTEMLGFSPEELLGTPVVDFMEPHSKELSLEAQKRRRNGIKEQLDLTFVAKSGASVLVSMSCAPIFAEDGRYVGAFGLVRDVTEQRNLMAQLMVSDRMASVGTLAAGVAHEINNPLTVVIANLSHLASNLKSAHAHMSGSEGSLLPLEDVKDPIDDAREAAERVRLIVRDLKLFSRAPDQELRGAVDVRVTVASSLRMASNEIRHRARLIEDFGMVPLIEANEARLGQVFLNLIVNAAQAMPAGRIEDNEIRISTRTDGDRVVIEVRDTGEGIPTAVIGRIFDAFYTTKPVGVGTGLGLAISHRIVTGMGGELTVTSKVGVGTTFRVSLPIGRAVALENTPASESPVAVAEVRGRILVVDDEEIILRSVRRILSAHDVVTLSRAEEALALVGGGERFDLILCDLMMPNMAGMDLHRELQRVAPDQADVMLFVTGGAFTPAAAEFLGAHEHIDKPFDADELRAVVRLRVSAANDSAAGVRAASPPAR